MTFEARGKIGKVRTEMRADDVLYTIFQGHVNSDVIQQCIRGMKLAIATHPDAGERMPYWLVDATNVGYDASIMIPARELLKIVETSQRKIIGAIKLGSVSMIARTLCLAAGVTLYVVDSMDEAEAKIDELELKRKEK